MTIEQKRRERDRQIYALFLEGTSIKSLSQTYDIKIEQVRLVIKNEKKRLRILEQYPEFSLEMSVRDAYVFLGGNITNRLLRFGLHQMHEVIPLLERRLGSIYGMGPIYTAKLRDMVEKALNKNKKE